MEALIPLAIWAVIILVGLALLALALFGLRSLSYGKVSPLSIVMVVVPVALLLILGFTIGDWSQAAIFTLLIMFGLSVLALLLSGLRSMFSF